MELVALLGGGFIIWLLYAFFASKYLTILKKHPKLYKSLGAPSRYQVLIGSPFAYRLQLFLLSPQAKLKDPSAKRLWFYMHLLRLIWLILAIMYFMSLDIIPS